jgi:membrane protease subunit HflK
MNRLRYLLLLLLVGYLFTGIAEVRPEERAVVRRFGKVVARPGPGLWVGLPWGIDRVDRVSVGSLRQLDVGYLDDTLDALSATPPGQLLTGDQNLVNVKLVLEYAVDDRDGELDDYVANRDRADAILSREAEALAAEWVAGQPVDEVLLAGRAMIPVWVMDRLPTRIADHRLGLIVQRVSVDHLAPPEEVREAFEQVTQAQTAIRTRENQAEQEAAQRLREAQATKFKLEQQAVAYRQEQLSLAAADAEAFRQRLEQYHRLKASNPDLLTAIWWEEMGKTLLGLKGRGRIDVLDHHLSPDGLDVTQFLPPKRR